MNKTQKGVPRVNTYQGREGSVGDYTQAVQRAPAMLGWAFQ